MLWICIVLMLVVFGKLLALAFKAAWGITKLLFTFIFLPVILLFLVIKGIFAIAIPVLIIIGIVSLISGK